MSILQKVFGTVIQLMPDRPIDPLIGNRGQIGQPKSRLDGPKKVAGAADFAADVQFDNLAFAAIVCSTIAKGRVARIEITAAERAPGVIGIITHQNAPKMAPPPCMIDDPNGAAQSNLPVLQDDSVRWNGQPIAVVVAETQLQAEYASSLVRVEYETEPAKLSFEKYLPEATPPKNILGEPTQIKRGDAETELAKSEFVVDEFYETPRYNHCAIELHGLVAHWESSTSLRIYDASQTICASQHTLAKVFGLKEQDIRITAKFVGGAFGNKGIWNHNLLCIAAAKLVDRPVRLVLTREQVFRVTGGRTVSRQRVALGARKNHTLAALIHTGTTAVVSHNNCPEQFSFPARHLYAVDNLLIEQTIVKLDTIANTFMRAPGESIGTFALESAIDELAAKKGIDPIELRRILEPKVDPAKEIPFSSRHIVEAYARGAERFGWERRNSTPGSHRDGEWLIGQGVATAFYPYYRMPGGSARIRLTADGFAVVQAAAHEMGMGTATVQAQHAAERLGISVEKVAFEYGDSNLPHSPIAGGSNQSATVIASVTAASQVLIKELLKLVKQNSPLYGAKPKQVITRDGGLYRKDDPKRGETYQSILASAGRAQVECEANAPLPLEMMKYSMGSYGAQFCEVRVNGVTGEVRVSRWLGSFDTGRILNAKTAASQFRGGIIMGIGLALMEETLLDERTGRIMNPSLAEYHVPVHRDVPEIDVMWTDIPDPKAPLGVHGIGEIGITGVAGAIANAVFNATGKRIRTLPITLDKILQTPVSSRNE